jgi:hypothetical protein
MSPTRSFFTYYDYTTAKRWAQRQTIVFGVFILLVAGLILLLLLWLFFVLICQIICLHHNSTHLTAQLSSPFWKNPLVSKSSRTTTYNAFVSCGMFWLRGTNVKSNRQQETVRVSAVHVHGLNNSNTIISKKKLYYSIFFFFN